MRRRAPSRGVLLLQACCSRNGRIANGVATIMTALTLYPGDRPEGRRLRPAAPRRDGPGHGLRRRPGRAGAGLAGRRLRLAARGRPQRRLRRPPGQRRAVARHPRRASACRCSSAAASATWPASSAGSRPACAGSSWAAPRPRTPRWCCEACQAFPGRIAVGIDARDGFVATEGWAETSTMRAADLALRFEDAGAAAIIYTDIGRDGMLSRAQPGADRRPRGADLPRPVIASGGVGSLADLAALKRRRGPAARADRGRDRRPRAV